MKRMALAVFLLLAVIPTAFAQTVYITNTGGMYHNEGCQYLAQSKIAVDLLAAVASGFTPCSVCNAPAVIAIPSNDPKVAKALAAASKKDDHGGSVSSAFVPAFKPGDGPYEKIYEGPVIGDKKIPAIPKSVTTEGCCLVILRDNEIARVEYYSPEQARKAMLSVMAPIDISIPVMD